jgi:hypothetical protein
MPLSVVCQRSATPQPVRGGAEAAAGVPREQGPCGGKSDVVPSGRLSARVGPGDTGTRASRAVT